MDLASTGLDNQASMTRPLLRTLQIPDRRCMSCVTFTCYILGFALAGEQIRIPGFDVRTKGAKIGQRGMVGVGHHASPGFLCTPPLRQKQDFAGWEHPISVNPNPKP